MCEEDVSRGWRRGSLWSRTLEREWGRWLPGCWLAWTNEQDFALKKEGGGGSGMAEGSKDLLATANLSVLFVPQSWMDPCFGWQVVPGQSEDGDHCPDSHLFFTKPSEEEGMVVVYLAPHPIPADS